mmetsp:Transcript_39497/g.111744  ORF Transcript_39497/g.111744 Transcript_39497/m.111744 type:complete len:125 (-) Transcript_39497:981-1355(-)
MSGCWCGKVMVDRHIIWSCALGPERLGQQPHSLASYARPRGSHVTQRVSAAHNSSQNGTLTGGWWGSYHLGGSMHVSVEKLRSDERLRKDMDVGNCSRPGQQSPWQQVHQHNPQQQLTLQSNPL